MSYYYYVVTTIILLIIILYFIAKKNTYMRTVFSYIATLILVIYLIWRGIYTLPTYSLLSLLSGVSLYVAEVIGLLVYMFFIILFRKQVKDDLFVPTNTFFQPKVCVFICTYNEDLKLVMATALAVRALEYPNKQIYICDDGHRSELNDLCNKFEIDYLSREDNKHGKAGNINYALSQTESELFMILDADFIVKKNFIYEAVPHFFDEKVALVQYPQSFYNKDPFQLMRNDLYNEQELFMRFLEPELAKENALIHIGTNAILRRSAIESIGGIPTKSITEDMATGLLLQNKGYLTKYINKAYALGVTPYKVADLALQRERWAQGTMQIFKNYKPIKMSGLNRMQKLCYYNAYLYWYTSFQKMIYIIAPTLFMTFDIFVVRSDISNLFIFFLPPLLMIILSFRLYIPSVRTLTSSHIYDTFVAPIHSKAIIKEFFKSEKQFKVTPKKIENSTNFDYKTIRTHIILAVWISVSLIVAMLKIINGTQFIFGYLITSAWSIYNLYGLINVIASAKSREIISDADALSITIDEEITYDNTKYNAFQLSFNGFRIKNINSNSKLNFEISKIYILTVDRTGLKVSAECTSVGEDITFTFKNLTIDAANRLASYYSDQLHAAKPVNIE